MIQFFRSVFAQKPHFTWEVASDYLMISLGALLQALALRLFLVPANLVNGGISGLSQIINHYTGWPIGLMIFLGNLPLFFLGWRFLGGRRFTLRTAYAIITISVLTDATFFLFNYFKLFPANTGLTNDLVLNTLYGGVVSGVGYGLVYRGQGTSGGSDILARMLNNWKGVSISQSYMLTDSAIMFLAGLSFNWEHALYALVMLYVSGVAAEAAMVGSNVVRTAMIITSSPDEVAQKILYEMERGVTLLEGKGAYTGKERIVLYCVVSRAEINQLKAVVHEADAKAFMVIGQAFEALGEGFRPLKM